MFCVLLMAQHTADTSFNLTRFLLATACQRFIMFLMLLRCRIALPKYSIALNWHVFTAISSCTFYAAFAAAIALDVSPSPAPPPINNTVLHLLRGDDEFLPLGKLRYVGIIAAVEIIMAGGPIVIPYLTKVRMPLQL